MKRTYVFKHPITLEHYTADAFTVRCVDDRFGKSFKLFMDHLGYGRLDPKSPAGGAKVFASPENPETREHYFSEIATSIKLHHARRVLLSTHHDCGAYGGIARFGGDENKELEFHILEHQKARAAVSARFPDLKIETYFIDTQGVIKTS